MNSFKTLAVAGLCVSLSLGAAAQSVVQPTERLLNRADIEAANPFEGIYSKRVFADTFYMTMVTAEAGSASGEHNHPDEQAMLFHTGRVRAIVGENEYEVGPDDVLIIPAYVPHQMVAIEDATWTEIHGPGFHYRRVGENQ